MGNRGWNQVGHSFVARLGNRVHTNQLSIKLDANHVSREAVFFLITNTLIVFGLIAFDNALAVLYTCRESFPTVPALPSPALLVRALLKSASTYDDTYVRSLQDAVERLRRKSRSFYLASGCFQGRLRADLILL